MLRIAYGGWKALAQAGDYYNGYYSVSLGHYCMSSPPQALLPPPQPCPRPLLLSPKQHPLLRDSPTAGGVLSPHDWGMPRFMPLGGMSATG